MTDDQHGEGAPQGGSRWDPLPQGEYDDGATAFVKLPEGGIDALLAGDSPLAAPGHGYVPPRITTAQGASDPAATGTWGMPADGGQWPDANAVPQEQAADDRFTYNPGATQQWTYEEPAAPPAPGHDVTGQWSIPVAGGDLPDESGEFTTSSLVEQWGGTPPSTLPGGAPAPWASESAGRPWGQQEPAHQQDPVPRQDLVLPQDPAPQQDPAPRQGEPVEARAAGHAPAPADHGTHAPEGHGGHEGYEGPEGHEGFAPEETYSGGPAGHVTAPHGTSDRPGYAADGTENAAPSGQGPAQAPEGPVDGPPAHPATTETPHTPQATGTPVTAAASAAVDASGAHELSGAYDPSGAQEHPGVPDDTATASSRNQAPADAQDEPNEPGEPGEPGTAPLQPNDDHPLASYVLRVNGGDRPVTDAWIGESLLYVLRERLGLAGAKDGCSQGECGACNVQVDGRLVASCLVPAVTASGSEVRTVEGLAVDGQPSDVQRALARCGAVQCGFCVPGMAMTLHDLLEGNPAPTEMETRQALCGNLCRCSGYRGVVDAVKEVVAEREAHTAAPDDGTGAAEARIPHQAGPGAGGVNPSAFEAPGAFDSPGATSAPGAAAATGVSGPSSAPGVFDAQEPHDPHPGPLDQHYGQDGGQA
ncbi:2Fe-2S iron-sulfur cluster-binding protein [Streptomyces sp. NPDC048297]|uniref:2Fe-2S iron-sulfur cluster-binding protein n=1 Tax=Streptomyces sp. NPDC048297 TaxID=3365531 RepID=UPI00371A5F99